MTIEPSDPLIFIAKSIELGNWMLIGFSRLNPIGESPGPPMFYARDSLYMKQASENLHLQKRLQHLERKVAGECLWLGSGDTKRLSIVRSDSRRIQRLFGLVPKSPQFGSQCRSAPPMASASVVQLRSTAIYFFGVTPVAHLLHLRPSWFVP